MYELVHHVQYARASGRAVHEYMYIGQRGAVQETCRNIAGGSASFAEAGPNTREIFRRTHGALVPSMVR